MTIDIEEITLTAELCELPENIKIAIYNCLNDFSPYYNYAFKLKTKYMHYSIINLQSFIIKSCLKAFIG